eukprot:jgi/Tetstr1/420495/TSEL_011608.t1
MGGRDEHPPESGGDDRCWHTIVTTEGYAPGVACLADSLRLVGSAFPLLCWVDGEEVAEGVERALTEQAAGGARHPCEVRLLPSTVPSPPAPEVEEHEGEGAPPLFRDATRRFLWQRGRSFIFLDADMIVLRNIDSLFDLFDAEEPSLHAVPCFRIKKRQYGSSSRDNFNAGLMVVVRPAAADLAAITAGRGEVRAGWETNEEKLLNEVFRGRWRLLPPGLNASKRCFAHAPALWDGLRPDMAVLHFVGGKPWQAVPADWEDSAKYRPLFDLWWAVWRRTLGSQPPPLSLVHLVPEAGSAPPAAATPPPQPRVLSLLSAATEMVHRLGCSHLLVGRSHGCDWPPAVRALPAVSAPRLDPSAGAAAIDAAVRRLCEARQPAYSLDDAAVAALAPTVIIAQNQCRVCAVTAEDLRGSACGSPGPQMVTLEPKRLADVLDNVAEIADALGVAPRGAALVAQLRGRLAAVEGAAAAAGEAGGGARPRVALLEWNDPLMGCGYWIPELIELARGHPVCSGGPGGRTPTLGSLDALLAERPQVVVFALCGFDIPRAVAELRACGLLESTRWRASGCAAFVMDGNALVNRSGPRLVESAEALAEAIHPTLAGAFGHLGTPYLMALPDALALHPPAKLPEPVSADPPPAADAKAAAASNTGVNADANADADAVGAAAGDGTPGTADPVDSGPSSDDAAAIAAVVRAQLQALACGALPGVQAAFALNSPENQSRLGGAARFHAILAGAPAFAPLLGPLPAPARLLGAPRLLTAEQAAAEAATPCGPPPCSPPAGIRPGQPSRGKQVVAVLERGSGGAIVAKLEWDMALVEIPSGRGSVEEEAEDPAGRRGDKEAGSVAERCWMTDGVRMLWRREGAGGGVGAHAETGPGVPVIVVAGTHSGVGKTSVTVGLIRALTDRGLEVATFKVGPDFLDPLQHQAAARSSRSSVNLDGWMAGRDGVLRSFWSRARGADIAVVEGVMGVFDGRDGLSETGSSAEVAKWLGAPVLLVLDCWALSRSAAALLQGYAAFDAQLRVEGVVLNKVGGDFHTKWLRDAILSAAPPGGAPAPAVLGGIPKDPGLAIAERHLGLAQPAPGQPHLQALAAAVEAHLDVDALLALAATAATPPPPPSPLQEPIAQRRVRIAVAQDDAFCFRYADSLALLEAAGAQLVPFSPLADAALPGAVGGVFLPGGYPELHAPALAANGAMRAALRDFAAGGGVVYAECGGLMYCAEFVDTTSMDEAAATPGRHAGLGLLPFGVAMTRRMAMGYVTATAQPGGLFPPGAACRGQVYHFSRPVAPDGADLPLEEVEKRGGVAATLAAQREAVPGPPGADGFMPTAYRRVVVSYVHLYLPSCPAFGLALVAAAAEAHQELHGQAVEAA